jgi:hypothetical protein
VRLWIAAVVPSIGLFLVFFQMRHTRRTTDATTLTALGKEYRELEAALISAGDKKLHKFHDLLNFLETQAAIHNNKLYQRTTRGMTNKLLCNAVAFIKSEPQWEAVLDKEFSFPDTLDELKRYIAKNHKKVAALTDDFKKKAIQEEPSDAVQPKGALMNHD